MSTLQETVYRNDSVVFNLHESCYTNTNYEVKGIYFVIYRIISKFTDKGQCQYLTNLKRPQEGTYLYTTQFLSLR